MKFERPFDALNGCKGNEVTVELKNSKVYKGKLIAFDVHLNLALSEVTNVDEKESVKTMIVRGDTIVTIKLE